MESACEAQEVSADAGAPRGPDRAGTGGMGGMGGRIHVAGGAFAEDMRTFASHIVYDPADDAWSELPPMPTPRHSMAWAFVDGPWYVMGEGAGAGFFTVFTDADVVEMYDPQATARNPPG